VPRVLQAVESKQTVLELVANGFGVALIQRSAATGRDGVRYVPLRTPLADVETVIAWREDAAHASITPFADVAAREAAQAEEMATAGA
jgi:DNA-binding transcriptional LysR family regulator